MCVCVCVCERPIFIVQFVFLVHSAMVYMKWAELSSNAEIVTKEYLEQLEASKESILPNDSIVSQFYISRVVKYKGDQQLQKGNYRLVIGDKNNYSDTLSFEVIN